MTILPGLRQGTVVAPPSKSHAHRLLIANFLAGINRSSVNLNLPPQPSHDTDSDDILATKRCLAALAEPTQTPVLDCGESGSTLRFLAPLAAALGKTPQWVMRGRLKDRPFKPYATLKAGRHELAGDVSSQFVTGLLFALPLLEGASQIRFTSPLESRGYVDMTLQVLKGAGIVITEVSDGFDIVGPQTYRPQSTEVEGDWSGAAFWLAMNALGSDIKVTGLNERSVQPDRVIAQILQSSQSSPLDVSQCPDIFPVLTVVAAARDHETRFTGICRLRLKECDRVTAMADVLERFGVKTEVSDGAFVVFGSSAPFRGGAFTSYGDHRIAMSIAVGATRADGPVTIDDADCAAKSYPTFFAEFTTAELGII